MTELVRKDTSTDYFFLFCLSDSNSDRFFSPNKNSNMKHQREKFGPQRWTESLLSEVWKMKTLNTVYSKPQNFGLFTDHNTENQSNWAGQGQ